MAKLIITRGLPGSGKTTQAKEWVAQDPEHRARVNRDDIRAQLHGGTFVKQDAEHDGTERQVTAVRDAMISTLLGRGIDVINDDTNLRTRYARDLRRLAQIKQAEFEVWDLTDVDPAECMDRNANRTDKKPVPNWVIQDYFVRYIRGKGHPLPLPDEPKNAYGLPYIPIFGTPPAVLVDIDGTVALMGTRDPFDSSRVHEDSPNHAVIRVVETLYNSGETIIFLSGRSESTREATEKWLADNIGVEYAALHMRPEGDGRRDSTVKLEIFDREIRDKYTVTAVLDDRRQVVDMWRSLGLTVLQVAPGEF